MPVTGIGRIRVVDVTVVPTEVAWVQQFAESPWRIKHETERQRPCSVNLNDPFLTQSQNFESGWC